jgi:hypothetical protein
MFSVLRQRSAIRDETDRMIELIQAGLPASSADDVLLRDKITGRFAATVRRVMECASDFAVREDVGSLSRAYLANRIKRGLKDLGYSNEFLESITASIVIAMERGPYARRRSDRARKKASRPR